MILGKIQTYPLSEPTTLKENLSVVWEIDETSGTTLYDSYGTNNINITTSGGTYAVGQTGKIDKSAYFYHNTSRDLRIEANSIVITSYPFSISVWAKITNFSVDFHTFYCHYYTGTYYGVWLQWIPSTNVISVNYGNGVGGGSQFRKSHNFAYTDETPDTWHLFILTSTGFNAVNNQIYADNNALTYTTSSGTGTYVNWGTNPPVLANDNYRGYQDQTAIWSKVLDSTERTQLYNSGNGLPYSQW